MAQQQQQQQSQWLQPVSQPAVAYRPAQGAVSVYGGSQPVYLQRVQAKQEYSPKSAQAALTLGVIQILAGLLCIIFQSAAISIEKTFVPRLFTAEFPGTGIWCGFVFLICGILGVCSGKKNTKSLIISFMTFNIVSSILLWVLVGFAAANIIITNYCSPSEVSLAASQTAFGYVYQQASATYYNKYGPQYSYVYYYSASSPRYYTQYYSVYQRSDSDCSSHLLSSWKAMDALLLILAILEFAVALAASINCCKALGCCCQPQPTFIIQQALTSPPTANIVVQGYAPQLTYQGQGASIQQPIGYAQPVQSASGAAPPYGGQPYPQQYGMQPSGQVSSQAGVFHMEAAGGVNLHGSTGYQPQASTASSPEYTNLAMLPSYDDVRKADLDKE